MIIDLERYQLKCLRCGWRWFPKKADVRQCPGCQSTLWDTPRDGQPAHHAVASTLEQPKLIAKPTPQPKAKSEPKPTIKKPETVSDQVWEDFKIHRKAKNATITQTVLDAFIGEASKAKISIEDALKMSIVRNWQGFKAEWIHEGTAVNGEKLEPCTARVRNQDGTRYVPCGKPSIRKQGLGFLCVDCDKEYKERQAREGKP